MKLLNPTARRSAAVLAGVLLLSSVTACGGSGQAASAVDKTTLTIGVESDSASFGFDPLRVSDAQRQFFEGLYENLMTLQADGSVGPGLATGFSYNADNTVLTLTLKEGVTFTDGSTLDAALVKANFDRRTDPALSAYSAIAKGGAQEITSVAVVSPTQVSLTFAKAAAGLREEPDLHPGHDRGQGRGSGHRKPRRQAGRLRSVHPGLRNHGQGQQVRPAEERQEHRRREIPVQARSSSASSRIRRPAPTPSSPARWTSPS